MGRPGAGGKARGRPAGSGRTTARLLLHDGDGRLGKRGTWDCHTQARVPAPEFIAQRLAISVDDLCVRTDYEFLADGRPAQLSTSWEPMAITDGTPILVPEMGPLAGAGVVERMRSIGVEIERSVEVPRPGHATKEQAHLLGINLGELVLTIERTYFDTNGRPVETADIIVPDSRWEVAYEMLMKPDAGESTVPAGT